MNEESQERRHYVKNGEIVERTVENAKLLVNTETDAIFHLNQMGTAIWHLLENPITVEEIITIFTQAFPESPVQTIEDDVENIVGQLEKKRLVFRADGEQL